MKIVFVTSTLSSGGSERVMALLANNFSERGHQVEIVCLNRHDVFYPIDDDVKVLFAREEAGAKFIGAKMLWLRKHIRRERPDVVIAFMVEVYCVTLASMIGMNVPVISSERIQPQFFGHVKGFLRWLLLRRTAHLVVQTERIKAFYSKALQARTSIIYNPVTDKVFGLPEEKKENRIIAVGRLAYQKNYPMLFDAFRKVLTDFPQYQLVIYGEGPQRQMLEEQIAEKGLAGKVVMAGRTEHVIEEMNRSKVFCMTSDFEGMSNAMLEAICIGLPVVTTDVSGARDLVKDGVNGFVTEIGNTDQFAEALRKVLSDEALMVEMGRNNKAKAVEFRTEKIVDQWETLINQVISEKIIRA
jgi:GalNAc-alpha-(1->4)-GalNAc-alpha-(1->3)-diNAcBac-PP-undecaprenol alpha-1,4-N-acetyl-D-galactosaminyltransferase